MSAPAAATRALGERSLAPDSGDDADVAVVGAGAD